MPTWKSVVKLGRVLPEVEESTWFNTPALKVRGKAFARLREDGETLVVMIDFMEREALTQENPDVYFFTDHYADYPAMLIRLERVDEQELRELLIESWRRKAPKRLLTAYDEANPPADAS